MCFSHDVSGAVIAAHWILLHMYYVEDYAEQAMSPGPMRDAVLLQVQTQPRTTSTTQLLGWRVESASADEVVVKILALGDRRRLVSTPVRMLWREGDWIVDSATDLGRPQLVRNREGFTLWEHTTS